MSRDKVSAESECVLPAEDKHNQWLASGLYGAPSSGLSLSSCALPSPLICRLWRMVPAEHLEIPSPGARTSLLSSSALARLCPEGVLGCLCSTFQPKDTESDSHMMRLSFLSQVPLIFSVRFTQVNLQPQW